MQKISKKTVVSIVCFLVILQFTQCKQSSATDTGKLVEIDISKKYPVKEIYLQDIAKVEYIPLETNNSTLIKPNLMRIYVSDDYIITTNPSDGDIFVFDGKGKSKFSFNHKGQGPTEYNNLFGGIVFDEKAKEIFIFNRFSSSRKIIVYAEDGEFKRTLANTPDIQDIDLYNFDDETLLVYDISGVYDQYISDQIILSNKPYMLMSKKDGSIVDTININLSLRISDAVLWQEGEYTYSVSVPINNNRSFGKDYLIADWSSDTIYRLTSQRELQPMFVRKPPVLETEPKILISNFLITEKFILFGVYVMDYNILRKGGNINSKQLMYDFNTGEINEYRFKNKDITTSTDTRIWEAVTPENTGVCMYNADLLFSLDDKGELKGDLKELLKSIDEEDNPILMKIKF